MTTSDKPTSNGPDEQPRWLTRVFQRYRWLPYVLPLAVFLITDQVEPHAASGQSSSSLSGLSWESVAYPLFYCVRIGLTVAAVVLVWPVYRRVPLRLSRWAMPVGILGVIIWVGLCRLGAERTVLQTLGLEHWLARAARPAFNPFATFSGTPVLLVAFLLVRFVGLALLVPLIEEFFLRGFLMRYVVRSDWWDVPLGRVTWLSAITATVYGMAAHPAEVLAAAVWFSLVTVLYWRTRKLWDCVVAHAVTNALLGAYILLWQDWTLW